MPGETPALGARGLLRCEGGSPVTVSGSEQDGSAWLDLARAASRIGPTFGEARPKQGTRNALRILPSTPYDRC